jgi:hypothetical protein
MNGPATLPVRTGEAWFFITGQPDVIYATERIYSNTLAGAGYCGKTPCGRRSCLQARARITFCANPGPDYVAPALQEIIQPEKPVRKAAAPPAKPHGPTQRRKASAPPAPGGLF